MTTTVPAPPNTVEQLRELLDLIEGCTTHPRFVDVQVHIHEHDATLGEDGKPLGWVLEQLLEDEDTLLARAHAVRSAARVFAGIVASLELEARRARLVASPYFRAAFGRALEVIQGAPSALESDQARRDLRWALPKAEQVIFAAEAEVPALAEGLEEAERWFAGGWEGVLDEGSFPHRALTSWIGSDVQGRISALLHAKRRESLAQALVIFVSVVARNGHDMFEPEFNDRLEEVSGRKIARARQPRQASAGGGATKRTRAEQKARARQRGLEEAKRRAEDPNRGRGYPQEGGMPSKKK